MNNKILTWGIIILLLAAGAFIVINRSATPNRPAPSVQGQPTQPASTNKAEEKYTATLTPTGFSPSTLTIEAGEKVTWINKSGKDAAINSDPHPIHTDYRPLNLGSFSNGGMLSLLFDKPGSYGYHNHLNPSQTGTIIVK